MPRAILAMRRYPATLLLAMFLFLATLILTAGSLGTVSNGGGDDGDGGSGIGGTGKSGEFGGSGFGGTGGPSPFFTSTDDSTQSTETPAEPNVEANKATSPLQLEIAQSIEQNVLTEETQRTVELVQETPMEIVLPEAPAPVQLAEAVVPADVPTPRAEAEEVAATAPVMPQPSQELTVPARSEIATAELLNLEAQAPEIVNAAAEPAALPAETMTVAHESEEEKTETTIDRNSIPDRIQRPELPPFQRIRPVERPSLLPSRVQPMRI